MTNKPGRLRALTDDDLTRACQLRATAQTLILATSDASGAPLASYAPFVVRAGALYVFVSQLAAHHHNLARLGPVSALIIADERAASQPFARMRLTLRCHVHFIDRQDHVWAATLDAFEARFGNIVTTLRSLADFDLVRLDVSDGTFVQGFGKAHRLAPTALQRLLA